MRMLIVDDHRMFREGIRARLEQEADIEAVMEAASAEEALEIIPHFEPTFILLDIRLPKASGLELAKQVRVHWPHIKVLILSGYDFDQYVRAAARLGVDGYLLKDSPQEDLVLAVRRIQEGGAVLPPHIASKVIKGYALAGGREPRQVTELTVREVEILELLYQGLRNADIATRLGISHRTVEAHVSNIISKIGAGSRTDAVRIAVERRLIF
jgi:DNA-binding NarL/FixJ family response regulator